MMDVGSYTGLYALMASAIRPDLNTVAFEASAMTYGRLSHNVLLNQAEMKIVPAHYAISNKTDSLDLGHAYGIFTMASGESIQAEYQIDHKESVPAETLDRLLCLNGEPRIGTLSSVARGLSFDKGVHAMKIDTEGAEELVLLGAQGVLSRYRPHMIIEIFNGEVLSRIKTLLSGIGYETVAECEGCNYIFAHQDKSRQLKKQHKRIADEGNSAYRLERLVEVNIAALQ
ncbi:MAG: FkbM family methyltransferase [Hyphomicrobiaceae bacterium]